MFGFSPSPHPRPDALAVQLSDGTEISVQWQARAQSRSLRIRVSAHGVVVTTPKHVPETVVRAFLENHVSWLEQHAHALAPLPNNEVFYRGKPYTLQINLGAHSGERVQITDNTLGIWPVSPTTESATKVLERWLQAQAAALATPLIQTLAPKFDVEVPQLRFRQTKSRWGSCTQHGAIMLNWRLIHAPDEVFRYVVVHELAHRVHMNHSKDFWSLVRKFDPSYPVHMGWLKRHGGKCATPPLTTATTSALVNAARP